MPEEAGFEWINGLERERVARLRSALDECWEKGVSSENLLTLMYETGMLDWQPSQANERRVA